MADTTVNYKCPNCGAPLTFIPGKDTVTCEYCNTEFEVATIESLYAKQEELAAKAQAAKEEKQALPVPPKNSTENRYRITREDSRPAL